ncbi:Crp/Fnr family transcriptional regulator [Rhodovibrio salinarum]|uniref:Crp/Fnr family transcriptional regulator n=1 Tax=Rhodovibrio salinarum TaxID=1087 RepID=A0A934V1B3_9PROT|nr:Crp/Fnr family transcriptional regulator [Rhodovibrio salinarum]MBK1698440.1 Crp/Fnr family transcriptional regulator [Rhodovibrio salinarum]
MYTADRPSLGWIAGQGSWTAHFSDTALEQIAELVGPLFDVSTRNILPDGGAQNPVFLIAEGWGYSYYDFPDGRRHVVDVHPPGEIIGVAAACSRHNAPRVSTLTQVTAARLDGAVLRKRQDTSDDMARGLSRLLAAQQADLIDQMGSLARHTAYERVAAFLLRLYERLEKGAPTGRGVFACPVSQQVMGDLLGLSVVHVNRSLRRLAEDGILHKRASDVEILDARALRRLAVG